MNIGDKLTALRKEQGSFQKEIADDLMISSSMLSSYEHGKHDPTLERLCRLADYYHVSTDYLLGRTQLKNDSRSFEELISQDSRLYRFLQVYGRMDTPGHDGIDEYIDYILFKYEQK